MEATEKPHYNVNHDYLALGRLIIAAEEHGIDFMRAELGDNWVVLGERFQHEELIDRFGCFVDRGQRQRGSQLSFNMKPWDDAKTSMKSIPLEKTTGHRVPCKSKSKTPSAVDERIPSHKPVDALFAVKVRQPGTSFVLEHVCDRDPVTSAATTMTMTSCRALDRVTPWIEGHFNECLQCQLAATVALLHGGSVETSEEDRAETPPQAAPPTIGSHGENEPVAAEVEKPDSASYNAQDYTNYSHPWLAEMDIEESHTSRKRAHVEDKNDDEEPAAKRDAPIGLFPLFSLNLISHGGVNLEPLHQA